MDEVSLKALDEAGRAAAAETMQALTSMGACENLSLVVIEKSEAIGSNSLDGDFLQSLIDGNHLNSNFLKNASR